MKRTDKKNRMQTLEEIGKKFIIYCLGNKDFNSVLSYFKENGVSDISDTLKENLTSEKEEISKAHDKEVLEIVRIKSLLHEKLTAAGNDRKKLILYLKETEAQDKTVGEMELSVQQKESSLNLLGRALARFKEGETKSGDQAPATQEKKGEVFTSA